MSGEERYLLSSNPPLLRGVVTTRDTGDCVVTTAENKSLNYKKHLQKDISFVL